MKLLVEIEKNLIRFKDRPAVSVFSPPDKLCTLTYAQLKERVQKFSGFICEHGFQPNDFIILLMNKSPQLIEAILAIIINWGIPCSVNPKLTPSQVNTLISKHKPKYVVVDQHALISMVKSNEPAKNECQYILFDGFQQAKNIDLLTKKASKTINIRKYNPTTQQISEPLFGTTKHIISPGFCMFTSGSTGTQKGVLISRDDLLERAAAEVDDFNLTENDSLLNLLHYSFDVGLNQLFSCLLAGAHLVIINSWFPKDIITAIKKVKITGISSVPSIWADMLSAHSKKNKNLKDISSLRYITVSGGDLNKSQLEELKRMFNQTDIYKTYGQTEAFRGGILKPWEFNNKITSVGKPPKGTKVLILDRKGKVASPNEKGEIVFSGTGTMLGYLNDLEGSKRKLKKTPDYLREHIKDDNVIFTGDHGIIDDEGYLHVLGRNDGMIKTRGYRVYPKEVEGCILECDAVKNVAVVGIQSRLYGQIVVAEIVQNYKIEKNEFLKWMNKKMPSYMIPGKIYFVDNLPMTVNGKINYAIIKERYEKDEFYNIVPKDEVKKITAEINLPAFIYFKKIIKKKYNELRHCLPKGFNIHYAFKANPNKDVLECVKSLGMGADVGSLGELILSKEIGFSPDKVEFTGPGKTYEELVSAIDLNISSINIESIFELKNICKICEEKKKTANVGIRINPRVKSTSAAIKMNNDTQFGIIEDDLGETMEIVRKNNDLINFIGFHVHIGSQITTSEGIISTFKIILEKVYDLSKTLGIKVKKINFGGGWGVDMFGNKPPLDLLLIQKKLIELFDRTEFKSYFKGTRFVVEPGRFLAAECGLYVAKIIYKKRGYRKKFLVIDGGMHHHYAAAGGIGQVIRRNYATDIYSKNKVAYEVEKYTVVGSLCTPMDILASNVKTGAHVDVGDTIVFFNSGGYAFSASPVLFLGHKMPNEILV